MEMPTYDWALGLKNLRKSRPRMGFLPFHSLGNVTEPHL